MMFYLYSRWRWLLALLVVQLLLLSSCQRGGEEPQEAGEQGTSIVQPKPAKPVTFEGESVVYVVGPMSGRNAEKGQAQAAGARLAAEELNQRGGVLNRKIIVKVINDAGEPELALEAAKKVAAIARAGEKVIGVVLHEGSDPQLESVKQIYLDSDSGLNPLVVLPSSTEPLPADIDDGRFFRLSAPNATQASEIANLFQERNLRDVVLVHSSTSYGKALGQKFYNVAKNLDVRTVASFEIAPDADSYGRVVTKVREINPAALFYAGGDVEAAVLLSELFGFEFQGSIYGSDRALSYTVIDELGCQAEGMNFASVLPDPAKVMTSDQRAQYADLEGREPEPHTVAGHAGVEFIVRGYEKAGTLDAHQAAAKARQAKIKTLMGEVKFDAQGRLQRPKIHFFQVQCRLFKASFDREVGAGPPVGEGPRETMTTLLEKKFASDKEPIIFAGLNWASAQFGNSIARFIIESGFGYPTYSVHGSSIPLFQSLRKGDIHIFMEGWLPNIQELYEKALSDKKIADIGQFFGNAVQGWFVPKYVVEGDKKRDIQAVAPDLKSVSDLERYRHIFASEEQPGIGRLIDGPSGWFSYKINCMKLKAYRLDDKFAQITTGSESALFKELSTAYEKGKPILAYMYNPTWPMAKFDLTQVEEPEFTKECWQKDKKCAFQLSQIRKLVHIELPHRAPEVAKFLGKLQLDSDEISRILLALKEKDLKPEEAALDWLEKNESTWTKWVPSHVALKVKKALNS